MKPNHSIKSSRAMSHVRCHQMMTEMVLKTPVQYGHLMQLTA